MGSCGSRLTIPPINARRYFKRVLAGEHRTLLFATTINYEKALASYINILVRCNLLLTLVDNSILGDFSRFRIIVSYQTADW